MKFTREYLVRYAHCDFAGIVFFPQYFVLLNDHVEDWFAELGADFARLHGPMGLAVPTVRLETDFDRPSRIGDRLTISHEIERLGTSSVTLRREARCGDESRVRVRQTLVCMAQSSARPQPWPESLRENMQHYLAEETPT
ncbi:MAG: acyl-CoA thioesterase [Burkholderiaceae bacterium]|nr:acyl-CoA thioesterase [Burkholderiaceae bacterium]